VLLYAEFDGTGRCFAVDGRSQILYEFRDGQMERIWAEDPIVFLRSMFGLPAGKTLKDEGKICFHEEKTYDVVSAGTGSGADFTAEFSYYIEEDRSAIYFFNLESDALEQVA
jgi:hypothetical protein